MKYCEHCKVSVRTGQERCPLCQGELKDDGQPQELIFPKLQEGRKEHGNLVFQWMLYASILFVVLCFGINWVACPDTGWSFFVAGVVLISWILIGVGIKKRRNLLKNALWQCVFLEGALVIWDSVSGWSGWSITWFLPLGILVTLGFMLLLALIQRMDSPEYMIYIIMGCILGLLPLLLAAWNLVTVLLPSVLCAGISLVVLAALLIFRFRAVSEELHKKLHL